MSNLKSIYIGKAGELRVRSELVLRGLTPAVCDQDTGVDIIIAENGKRLQVKTSMNPSYSKKDYSWRYSFAIRVAQIRSNGDGTYGKKFTRRDYSDNDYFVFFLISHGIFYIIPVKEIGEKVSFCISTPDEERSYKRNENAKSVSKYEKYKNNWKVLK